MRLTIENPENLNLAGFCNYLIKWVKENLTYNKEELVDRDSYLQKIIPNYNWYQLINQAKNNFIFYKQKSTYIIELSNEIYIYRTKFKLKDLIALLEYGNNEMPKYPIFTKLFDTIAEDLQTIFEGYGEEEN